MSNKTEELLIAWRKSLGPGSIDYGQPSNQDLLLHADKLIAEREPKIMSAEKMQADYNKWLILHNNTDSMTYVRAAFLANIADVLNKKLADAEADSMTHSFDKARRIVADTLKDQKP